MLKNLTIAALALLIVVLTSTLVRVENERYALLVGMCRDKVTPQLVDGKCLRDVETRTAWWWHLYYALKD